MIFQTVREIFQIDVFLPNYSAKSGDVLIALSTSGNSKNVINAIKKANQMQMVTIGFSGNDGGNMKDLCKYNLIIPSDNTARIQEAHILVGHIICKLIEQKIFS